jgi:HlyD family secretion protein
VTQSALPAFLLPTPQGIEPRPVTTESTRAGRSQSGYLIRSLIGLSLLGLIGGGWWIVRSGRWKPESPSIHLPTTTVARANLSSVVTTWGRVESSQNTIISCEIERLEMRSGGSRISSGGASTILELVEEGTMVKAGDVLCSLDSSDYEELVRTQEIKTLQAAAALKQAQLNLEVAEISVREYQEGLYRQNLQSMEGLIYLARSDLERAVDRLKWTSKMLEKGYLAVAKKAEAEQTKNEIEFDLQTYRFNHENFLKFGNKRTTFELVAEVEKRRFEVVANTQRVTRNQERLAHYKKMLDLCTIRAPHDGFLIYAVDPHRPGALPIEPGQTVRQSQKLFFLPDLSKMQVLAYLHESVANRVHDGMRVRAKIEGLANQTLEGHVVSVAPLPTTAGNFISDEVKYFVSVVKLDSVPDGIRPGMSAEVEFDVERCLDVLAVSSEAIALERGHNVCYVSGIDGLERRAVTLGRSNRDLLEVTKGLAEGEQVVLRPEKVEAIDSMVVRSDKETTVEVSETTDQFSGPTSAPVSVD